jgi:hypothetical protein
MSSSVPSLDSRDPPIIRLLAPVSPAEIDVGTPILAMSFASAEEFLGAFAGDRGPAGELAVRTRATPQPGSPVVLEVFWPGLSNRVYLSASALRRWLGGHLILRIDGGETAKVRYLVAVANGAPLRVLKRTYHRYVVRLPIRWRRFGDLELSPGRAEDLSAGGLLISTSAAPPLAGERIALRLRAEAAHQDLVLTGDVRHVAPRPSGRTAFGVHLTYRSSAQQRTLRSLLRAFANQGVVLVDPSCQ